MSVDAGVSKEEFRVKGYKRQTTFLYILAGLIYFLPVRFGASWLTGNLPAYPDSFIFSSLPTSFLHILTIALFIYGVIIFKPTGLSRRSSVICFLWAFITLSCAAFGYFEENMEFYLNSINQMLTVTLITLTAAIAVENNPRTKNFIIAGLCGGLMHTVLSGVYQYLWGFADTEAFYREQMAQGIPFPAGQVNRIMQKLVYSTFTISNSFAGHLILTIPIFLLGWKKCFKKAELKTIKACALMLIFFGCSNAFSSSNVSLGLLATFVGLIFFLKGSEIPEKVYEYTGLVLLVVSLIVLALTKSRAGIVCFGAGFLVATFLMAEKQVHKNMAIVAMVIGFAAALYIAPQVGSFQVRLGYYQAMIGTFMEDIWGYGFGSFSYAYNSFKGAGIEESNIPHSFFFGYLGQGGIVAALAVVVCYFVTVYLIKTSSLDRFSKFCLIFGFSAWYFHAQLDFHVMIIGSLSSVGMVSLLCVTEEDKPSPGMKLFFPLLIPICLLTGFLNVQKIASDRSYFYLFQTLRDVKTTPSLDKVKNIVAKMDARKPYSVSHLRESGNWAINQYVMNKSINPIQKFEYLKFAEDNLLRSKEKYPLETGIYVSLAKVYKYQDNYEKARKMLDRAFEVYPFSPSATSLEIEILNEYRLRYPKESHFHEAFLKNKLKSLESHLGRLRFSEHLNLSSKQLNSIMSSLEKAANEIFAEIAIISGVGIKLDTSEISARVNEILEEARLLVK